MAAAGNMIRCVPLIRVLAVAFNTISMGEFVHLGPVTCCPMFPEQSNSNNQRETLGSALPRKREHTIAGRASTFIARAITSEPVEKVPFVPDRKPSSYVHHLNKLQPACLSLTVTSDCFSYSVYLHRTLVVVFLTACLA